MFSLYVHNLYSIDTYDPPNLDVSLNDIFLLQASSNLQRRGRLQSRYFGITYYKWQKC